MVVVPEGGTLTAEVMIPNRPGNSDDKNKDDKEKKAPLPPNDKKTDEKKSDDKEEIKLSLIHISEPTRRS